MGQRIVLTRKLAAIGLLLVTPFMGTVSFAETEESKVFGQIASLPRSVSDLGASDPITSPSMMISDGLQRSSPEFWLNSLVDSKKMPYRGRLVYVQNNQVTSVELLHGYINEVEVERIALLNGEHAQEALKIGNQMFCRESNGVVNRYQNRGSSRPLLKTVQTQVNNITKSYNAVIGRTERVAGRPCILLKLQPFDKNRFERHYCIDVESGYLMKYAIYSHNQDLLEAMEFVSFDIEDPSAGVVDHGGSVASIGVMQELKQVIESLVGREELFKLERGEFDSKSAVAEQGGSQRSSGATIAASDKAAMSGKEKLLSAEPWIPSGFLPTSVDMNRVEPALDKQSIIARNYSDGLSGFTLFYELNLDSAAQGVKGGAGHVMQGATLKLSRSYSATERAAVDLKNGRVSIVGEIPLLTAERILESVL